MRVLHVSSGIDRKHGGVSAVLIGLVGAQAAAGLNVSVLVTHSPGDDVSAADELRRAGIAVTLIESTGRQLFKSPPDLVQAIGRHVAEADVVHVHGVWENVQHEAMSAARRLGKPYLVTPHGMLTRWALSHRGLKKKIYLALRLRKSLRSAAMIHYATKIEADDAVGLRLGPPVLVEPHGIDLSEFNTLPPRGAFRDRYRDLATSPLVVFMGRMHAVKGLDLLIPAFARVPGEAKLILAGPDNEGYGPTLQSLIAAHQLEARVIRTGMLYGADRIAALRDADLFVLPSYLENFGMVALEALAAESPVVVSDKVGFSEFVIDQPFATVVPCDVSALADAMTKNLARPDAGRLADHGRRWAMERFDWSAAAERWKTHYAALPRATVKPATPV